MEKRIGHAIIATANLIRRAKPPETRAGRPSMTAMQRFFLGSIYINNKHGIETYQKDLEAEFSVRRSTASGILALMEDNGLIKREVSERDARLKSLILTDEGLEICKKRDREIEEIEKQLSRGVTRGELDIFFDVIARIRKNIDENDDWGDRFK